MYTTCKNRKISRIIKKNQQAELLCFKGFCFGIVKKKAGNQMKFYINNKELSEKVFWRTLDSLVSPIQRVHILDGMKVKIADYLCWIEIV